MVSVFDSEEWKNFEVFAKEFYSNCLQIAVGVAGGDNPKTIQILLDSLCPDLVTLWEFYLEHGLAAQREAEAST